MIECLLNPVNEDCDRAEISLESLVTSIVCSNDDHEDDGNAESNSDEGLYSIEEQLPILAVATAVFDRRGVLSSKT